MAPSHITVRCIRRPIGAYREMSSTPGRHLTEEHVDPACSRRSGDERFVRFFGRGRGGRRPLSLCPRAALRRVALRLAVVGAVTALFAVSTAAATETPGQVPQVADVEQKLDARLDLALRFRTATGESRTLRELIPENRPVLVVPVYYGCPRLCGMALNGVRDLLNGIDLKLGDDFRVLNVSFDPEEGPDEARAKAESYYAALRDPQSGKRGWEFLTGDAESVRALMESLGFRYAKDGNEFIHTTALIAVTPQGNVSRYFFGIEFAPQDVRLALVDASRGRIGTIAEKLFLYCFRFDHTQGKYSLVVWNVTRVICALIVLALAASIAWMRVREVRLAADRHSSL